MFSGPVMQISSDINSDFPTERGARAQSFAAFGETGEQHPAYFSATSRRTTLDMALYLARYSDLVLLIHGPAGSGKSTLLHEMITRGGPNIHAVTVVANPTSAMQSLYDAVLNSFKQMATYPASVQPIDQIAEQLDLLQRKGYHCILFIDDADQLTSDAYPFLETLADLRSEGGRTLLNLVLFAQDREKITFAGPSVRHRVKATELQPLAADEVAAYVEHVQRTRRVEGIAVEFQPREIQRIARASSGWPGNINALIEQRSARHTPRSKSALPLNHSWTSPRYLLGATSLAAALILVFVFQDSVNYWFEPQSVPSHTVAAPLPAPVEVVVAPPEEPVPIYPDTPPVEMVAAGLDPVESAPEPESTSLDVPIDTAEPSSALPVRKAATKPKRDKWLLAQNPDTYTLQIAWSSQESDIRRALKKFSLTDPAAVFSTSRKGKPWYGLVTGAYPDFTSATQARAALPEELMRGAWVRRLRAVQSEIKKPQETAESSEQKTGTAASTSAPAARPAQLP